MKDKEITLLYVDDEEINLMLFKMNFERNYRVYTALSAKEGLNELKNHHNDIIVVISDMRMPEMNGVEFIREARQLYRNIYYFILSGFDHNNEIDLALKNKEIEKFFPKPFVKEDIDKAIETVLKRAS